MLLDTASDVSILKVGHASTDINIDTTNTLRIKGITNEIVPSLGSCEGNFKLAENVFVTHPIHLVSDEFPLTCSGILGGDFLEKYSAHISYKDLTVTMTVDNTNCALSMSKNNSIIVPPRSEYTAHLPVDFDNAKVCLQKQLKSGIMIGNSITNPIDGYCKINLLNPQQRPIIFNTDELEFDDLENYYCFNTIVPHDESSRIDQLLSDIDTSHLSSEEKTSLLDIVAEFNDVFYLPGDKLSHTNSIEHSIPLTTKRPIFVKPYRLPEAQKSEIQQQIKKMLDEEIIEHSRSPYNAPILIVPKKPDLSGNRRWRLVVDFRKLNDSTESDAYPLPNIAEILDQLGSSKYFSVVDLATGFYQIPLDEGSKPLTAFSFFGEHYQFKRLPMGLKGSPATFQRLMNNVLTGMQGIKCLVYLDDIVIFGSSLTEHNVKLKSVFSRLREHNLKLQPNKCSFLRKEIAYLGHVISEDGIKPDPKKTDAVQNFPTPKTPKHIKSFMGLASYYRKFIPNFSEIASPLNHLLKKDVKFNFDARCKDSFEKLKKKLINPPILQFPDFSREFLVTTDASLNAIGGVLSQGTIGQDLPIAYASRTLNKAERNYSTIERELLGIIWTVQHFRPYLFGRKFRILTDHRPLVYLFSVSNPSSRLMRFRLKLEEYEYEIQYKPGKLNLNADGLSRMFAIHQENKSDYDTYLKDIESKVFINNNIIDTHSEPPSPNLICFTSLDDDSTDSNNIALTDFVETKQNSKNIYNIFVKTKSTDKPEYSDIFYSFQNLKVHCMQNTIDSFVIPSSEIKENRLKLNVVRTMLRYIFRQTSIKVHIYHKHYNETLSPQDIEKILAEFHVAPFGGHQGVNRTYNRIKSYHKWHKMYRDIKRYVKACETCQKNKVSKKTQIPMAITTTSSYPFEKVFLDIVGPLSQTENFNKYLLTLQDDLSKFSIAIPIPDQEAQTVARAFVTNVICLYGVPKFVVTDQGSNFISSIFKETCSLLGIKKLQSTAYHPQTNGSVERSHRTLTEYLRCFINKDLDNWDTFMPYATFTFNSTPSTATNFTPYELLYGRKPDLPSSLKKDPEVIYNFDDYYNELKSRLQHSHQIARETLIKNKERAKINYDKTSNDLKLKVGDKVLLRNEANVIGKPKKLLPLYQGPYEVILINTDQNCTIKVKNKSIKVHKNRLKLFIE